MWNSYFTMISYFQEDQLCRNPYFARISYAATIIII